MDNPLLLVKEYREFQKKKKKKNLSKDWIDELKLAFKYVEGLSEARKYILNLFHREEEQNIDDVIIKEIEYQAGMDRDANGPHLIYLYQDPAPDVNII